MSLTWQDGAGLVPPRPGPAGTLRAALRGLALLVLFAVGLAIVGPLSVAERLAGRSVSGAAGRITVAVCRVALRIVGLRVRVEGQPLRGPGAIVANHSSWLDILALNAQSPLVFLAKSEVAAWPGIGWLARATGTLFVQREARREAPEQARAVAERLSAGQTLAFFPEGTSTDNRRVLPFRSTLFAGPLAPRLPLETAVQPATLRYEAPVGEDPRFYAWFGSADLAPHVLAVLAQRRQGCVHVIFHPPIPVAGHGRKALAAQAEAAVRSAL